MRAARIDTAVAAVLQQVPGELQHGQDQLAIGALLEAQLCQLDRVPFVAIAEIDRLCRRLEEDLACEITGLRRIPELVCLNKAFEDVVKTVQKGDPVVHVAAGEGPSCRKLLEHTGQ